VWSQLRGHTRGAWMIDSTAEATLGCRRQPDLHVHIAIERAPKWVGCGRPVIRGHAFDLAEIPRHTRRVLREGRCVAVAQRDDTCVDPYVQFGSEASCRRIAQPTLLVANPRRSGQTRREAGTQSQGSPRDRPVPDFKPTRRGLRPRSRSCNAPHSPPAAGPGHRVQAPSAASASRRCPGPGR